MLKALLLILTPARTWQKIAKSERGVGTNLCRFLLPLLLFCSAAEGYELSRWGERRGIENHLVSVSRQAALRFEAVQLCFALVIVFLGAKILQWVIQSFHLPARYPQAFTVVAYGYSPIFLVRLVAGFPNFNSWTWWALGAVGAVHVLYHGVGQVLQPDQTKGFGLYLMCVLILVLLGGSTHLIARAVLHGRIPLPGLPLTPP